MTKRDQQRVWERVSQALGDGPYLMGERFTAADILVSGPFEWDPGLIPDADRAIPAWLSRLSARPAARAALVRDQADA